MKIRVCRIEDGPARVEVIDPSDGAIAHSVDVNVGEEVTVVATTANSPADIEVGEVGRIADAAPAEDAPDTGASAADAGPGDGEGLGGDNTASTAEGAEESKGGLGTAQTSGSGTKGVSEPDAA